jgi:hypothetical protein
MCPPRLISDRGRRHCVSYRERSTCRGRSRRPPPPPYLFITRPGDIYFHFIQSIGRTMNFNGGISEEAGEIKSAATGTFFFPSRRPVAFCFRRESHYNLDFHGAPAHSRDHSNFVFFLLFSRPSHN